MTLVPKLGIMRTKSKYQFFGYRQRSEDDPAYVEDIVVFLVVHHDPADAPGNCRRAGTAPPMQSFADARESDG